MATLDWPTGPAYRISAADWGVRTPRSAWQAFYTGQRQSISHLADRMRVTVHLPPVVNAAQAAQREAFFAEVASAGHWLRLWHVHRPVPLGTLRGAPTVAVSALAGARTLQVQGALASPNLLSGGSFEIDTNGDGLADGMIAYSFGSHGDVTLSRVASSGVTHGSFLQRVSATALGTTAGDHAGVRYSANVPVVPGASYNVSAYLALTTGPSAQARLYVDWYTAANVITGAAIQTTVALTATATRYAATGVAPSDAAYAKLYVWCQARGGSAGPVDFDVDALQFEQAGALASTYGGYPTLAGGDMLGVGGHLLMVGYAGAVLDDAGSGSVPLALPLLAPLSAGAAVTWLRPTGAFEIVGTEPLASYSAGAVQAGMQIDLAQVLP